MAKVNKETVRCAVYCRKSVEDGLEQDFNSLDAQREAGENYIASQKGNGWVCLPQHYDDGGFSGGNTNRPALHNIVLAASSCDSIIIFPSTIPHSLSVIYFRYCDTPPLV